MTSSARCPQPVQAPGTPLNLRIITQVQAAVSLVWDKTAGNDETQNYIVERGEQ
jgi:hypothetical protein